MRIIPFLLFAVFFAVAPEQSRAADLSHRPVRALLVIASKQPGESDGRLAFYEPTLRRILRFESFRLAGEGAADLAASGKASMSLGHGHVLEIALVSSVGRFTIDWKADGRSLMNTGLTLRAGVPAVLGGPSTGKDGEVWAVILTAD